MGTFIGEALQFQYETGKKILNGPDLVIEPGKMTAILGKNGCGKSTLVKLLMALLPLSGGRLTFQDLDMSSAEGIRAVRRHCGVVFQNPDNQFVSPIVEDDIRFGLDNHGIPECEQAGRIFEALAEADLAGFEKRHTSTLSGGQKQRAAAAGIFALQVDILIFDEAAAMLDPEGRAGLMRCLDERRKEGRTIVIVTQNTEEAIKADTVLLMDAGKIAAAGTPREILTDAALLKKCGVRIPFPVQVWHDLAREGVRLPFCPLTLEELTEEICSFR